MDTREITLPQGGYNRCNEVVSKQELGCKRENTMLSLYSTMHYHIGTNQARCYLPYVRHRARRSSDHEACGGIRHCAATC